MTDTCFGGNRVLLTGVLDSGSASVMLRGVAVIGCLSATPSRST